MNSVTIVIVQQMLCHTIRILLVKSNVKYFVRVLLYQIWVETVLLAVCVDRTVLFEIVVELLWYVGPF